MHFLASQPHPLRYRGYVHDAETGLYYLQSRYYDPETCRFVNADGYVSTGQGITGNNMFAYCNNNPVMYSDPTGTRIFECCPYGDCYCCRKNKQSASVNATVRDVTDEVNDALASEVVTASIMRLVASQFPENDKWIAKAWILTSFKDRVDHDAPWDIKQKKPWEETIATQYPGAPNAIVIYNGHKMNLEALGNYTYGYLGRAYGISLDVLLAGSYYATGFSLDANTIANEINTDWKYIVLGYYQK